MLCHGLKHSTGLRKALSDCTEVNPVDYESKFLSSADQNPIVIDTSKIPRVEVNLLCSTFLSAVQAFYEIPENTRRFKEWRAARMENGESLQIKSQAPNEA